ncbi:MAG: MAPEG family protein [Burkholderiales bacterium]|nr:MAPEG family protein [Burkholderiales bacterium]
MAMTPYQLMEDELRQEQRKVHWRSGAAAVVCAVTYGLAYLFLPNLLHFPDDLDSALTFGAGASLFIVLWIMVGIGLVSRGRRLSAQDIRGSAYGQPSPRIAVYAAFLQNTLEQATVTIILLLAVLLLLRGQAMPFVGASVVLFAVGRVAFLRGYPDGAGARAFGMALTALPSVVAFVAAVAAVVTRILR